MAFGRSNIFVVGKRVFVLLPVSCCTGDPTWSLTGVLRRAGRAR